MTTNSQKNILGISLGTVSTGMAVVYNDILFDWCVKGFKGKWCEEKKELILDTIDRMLELYEIDLFVIKVPSLVERHASLSELHREINFLAQKKQIPTETITIEDLKQFCGDAVTNKVGLRSKAFQLFPELKNEYGRALEMKNNYYEKLFEACLAAHVFRQSS
jgi:RNase H-fold protein (predicted Holliday junction resolvase)